jgi:glycosyltransferase involved in cell wall biosynthesis
MKMIWHVLDVRAVWIKEFAAALSLHTPTLGWLPQITSTGRFRSKEEEVMWADPALRVRHFPLQRGFAKFPVTLVAREADRVRRRLLRHTEIPRESVLICSSPHYATVAEKWPGHVIYYVTDLFVAYGEKRKFIKGLESRLCAAADLVCPNSQRIAEYLIAEARCAPHKISIIPNATRRENAISQTASQWKTSTRDDLKDLGRPVAGVIGNLAGNTEWLLLEDVIERTEWMSWVFVGPTNMTVTDSRQRQARERLQRRRDRVRFVGEQPYSRLKDYARAVDVAVLPYRKCEPTYSGSSTRFYEHLAAGRPMIATRGFEELLRKEPFLRLVDSADEMMQALEDLRASGFRDGREALRRLASQGETWEVRAATMKSALAEQTRSKCVV